MTPPPKQRLLELHRPSWAGARIWMGLGIAITLLEALVFWILSGGLDGIGRVVALVVLVAVIAHLMHAHLIAFHEAAHGSLCPARWLNDFFGLHVSPFNLLSLALYRAAHHPHHAYLATERDEELWPFVDPRAPRWWRRLAAFLELTCGLLFTPFLFFRTFLRRDSIIRGRAVRRRIWIEQSAILILWIAVLAAVAWWNLWLYWLAMYLLPAWIAGNLQSVRKYIEHMGLHGSTPLRATRTVVPTGFAGRLCAFLLFNEPYHGLHHQYGQMPQGALPELADALNPPGEGETIPFPSYRSALWDMLPTLADPKVGAQWLAVEGVPTEPSAATIELSNGP